MSFERLVAHQAGVVSLAQAVAAGMSPDTVQRRVQQRRWSRLHPGMYLIGGHRLTPEARIRGAWPWGGPYSVVTGAAAAYWHRMREQAPAIVELSMPANTSPRPQPGIRLRRRDLFDSDVQELDGIRLAAPPFAALETAVALPGGSTFLDRALQKHVHFPAVYRADSAAERLLIRLLRDAGIDGWALGHPLGPYTIDLAFPERRLAIEVDGWAYHVDPDRFRNDRRKGNYLARCGWDLLRFTWHGLNAQPDQAVAEIRETLALAA